MMLHTCPPHPLMKFESGVNEQMGLHLHVASKTDSYLRACVKYSPTFITIILPKQVNLSTWRVMGMLQWSCINFFFSFVIKRYLCQQERKGSVCESNLFVNESWLRQWWGQGLSYFTPVGMCCHHPDHYGGIISYWQLYFTHWHLGYCLHVGMIYMGNIQDRALKYLLCEGNKLHGSSLQVSTRCFFLFVFFFFLLWIQ